MTTEGFVSYFNASPITLFPEVHPNGTPTVALPNQVEVALSLPIRQKYCERLDQASKAGRDKAVACMPYLNTAIFFTRTRMEIDQTPNKRGETNLLYLYSYQRDDVLP
jgi:hypothetical protein